MSKNKGPKEVWACDFETTTDPLDCRVWAWGASFVPLCAKHITSLLYIFSHEKTASKGGFQNPYFFICSNPHSTALPPSLKYSSACAMREILHSISPSPVSSGVSINS